MSSRTAGKGFGDDQKVVVETLELVGSELNGLLQALDPEWCKHRPPVAADELGCAEQVNGIDEARTEN